MARLRIYEDDDGYGWLWALDGLDVVDIRNDNIFYMKINPMHPLTEAEARVAGLAWAEEHNFPIEGVEWAPKVGDRCCIRDCKVVSVNEDGCVVSLGTVVNDHVWMANRYLIPDTREVAG